MSYTFSDNDILLSSPNPYFGGEVIVFNDLPELSRNFINWEGDRDDFFHTVEVQDQLDSIADKYYRNIIENAFQYWWLIADANDIDNALDISSLVGTEIVIPNIIRFLTIRDQSR